MQRSRRYDVSPGLTRLAGSDFGNGIADRQLFQIDSEFGRYRANKIDARLRPARHVLTGEYEKPLTAAVARLIIERLTTEHPDFFVCHTREDGAVELVCRLTGETLHFDPNGMLLPSADGTAYRDGLDALCCQIQEDVAVVQRTPDGEGEIVALHVCAPSRWRPEEKIGCSFDVTHRPVPGLEKSRAAATGLVAAMIERPPTVRFTWGIEWTDRLNLHPDEPEGHERAFAPRTVSEESPPLYLRVERQTIWGLPEQDAALFVIRPYLYDLRPMLKGDTERRDALIAALHSMPLESRLYKGLPSDSFAAVITWLEEAG